MVLSKTVVRNSKRGKILTMDLSERIVEYEHETEISTVNFSSPDYWNLMRQINTTVESIQKG